MEKSLPAEPILDRRPANLQEVQERALGATAEDWRLQRMKRTPHRGCNVGGLVLNHLSFYWSKCYASSQRVSSQDRQCPSIFLRTSLPTHSSA